MSIDPVSLAITAALTAAQMALNASRKIEGPRLEDLNVTVADYGTPLNYFLGTRRFNAVPVIWAEEIREEKKKRKTKGGKMNEYRYYGTWAVCIADHDIDAVTRIWFDKHLIYDTTGSGPVFVLGKDNQVTMRVYLGSETQEPDPRMQATIEAEFGAGSCPAYRGVSYIVFEEVPLEKLGNRIPQISVEATRNVTQPFPYEQHDTTFSATSHFQFSPSGSWMLYITNGDTDVEWWHVPTRTRLGSSDDAGNMAGTIDRIGVTDDGSAYFMGPRIVGVDVVVNFYSINPLGVWSRGPDLPSATGYGSKTRAYDTNDPLNPRAVYTNRDGPGYFAYGEYVESLIWCLRDTFQDSDLDVWGIFQPDGASSQFALRNMTQHGPYHEFTGTARADVSTAYGCHSGYNKFVIIMDSTIYIIDPDTMTITDSGGPYGVVELPFNRPGSLTFWDGENEYSLFDGALIRSIDHTDWVSEDVHRDTYDPINHAYVSRPQFDSHLNWHFLDRANGGGTTLGAIVADVCERSTLTSTNRETSDLTQTVAGYSWTQGAGKSIIEPLLDIYDSICRPHDFKVQFLKRTGTPVYTVDVSEFVAGNERYSITIAQDTDLPRGIALSFADIDADQQPNTVICQRPLDTVDAVRQASMDLTTLVLDTDEARQLSERWFRRQWNSREQCALGLTMQRAAFEPGDVDNLVLDGLTRTAELQKLTFRADDTIATEWRRDFSSVAALQTSLVGATQDGRRESVILIPMESKAFALDIPSIRDTDNGTNPLIYMGAAPYGPGFWPGAIMYQLDGTEYDLEVGAVDSSSPSTWGVSTDALADATHYVWDRGNSVNVKLFYGTLASASEADCNANPRLNLALLGEELIQFSTATLEGDGTYTLTGLKRGRRGTEWATGGHAAGDQFILLADVAPVQFSSGDIGEDLSFRAATNGADVDTATTTTVDEYDAASNKPWAPDQLHAVKDSGTGDWTLTWRRRSRVAGDFAPGDPPLGESTEEYDVKIYRSGFGSAATRTITVSSETATYTAAQQVTDGGAAAIGDLDWGVLQVGDIADGYEKQASH